MDDSNSREPVDWRLCILCQESNTSKGAVVLNPRTESYQKILDVLPQRASVHNGQYVAIQRRLKGCTKEMLVDKEVTWHRSCYSYATSRQNCSKPETALNIQWPQDSILWKGEAITDQVQTWKQIYQGHQSHSQDLQQIFCQTCCAFSVSWIAGKLSSHLELWTLGRPPDKQQKFPKIQCWWQD